MARNYQNGPKIGPKDGPKDGPKNGPKNGPKVCHDCHTKHHLFDLDLEKYGLSSLGHTHYGLKLPKLSKKISCLVLL